MLKETVLGLCMFVGLCKEPQSFSDIAKCVGDTRVCNEVIASVEEIVPNHIEQYIVSTMDKIVIVTTDFQKYMHGKPIDEAINEETYMGITGYGYSDKTIIYSMPDTYILLHELGHAMDFSFKYFGLDKYSDSKEWEQLHESEYLTKRGDVNKSEYFAEAFAMYYNNQRAVKMFAPKTYEKLNSLLNEE